MKSFKSAIAACFFLATGANGATLDFEELSSGAFKLLEGPFTAESFAYRDFEFSTIETVFKYGPLNTNKAIPHSGSVFLNVSCGCYTAPNDGGSAFLEISQTDGSPFSVQSISVAEGRTFLTTWYGVSYSDFASRSLDFLGTTSAGSTVSFTHTFDQIGDHTGPEDDFETVILSGFEDLVALRLTGAGGPNNGYSFSIDDLVVNEPPQIAPVPLPASGLLLLGAILGIGVQTRRRKDSSA